MDLFSPSDTLVPIPIEDGKLALLARLALPWPNAEVLARLVGETAWRAETVTVFGKRHPQPRLSAWHGEASYTYSGLTLAPLPFTPLLQAIREAAEAATGHRYNSVLLNYYRDGRDSMGMHADNEPELGPEPAIASVSFGATRAFVLRHRRTGRTVRLGLADGSLLFMGGTLQQHWLHGINKTAKPLGPRVNLTFRRVV
jgi:alkylated DNA repair dioxygenase AlkB